MEIDLKKLEEKYSKNKPTFSPLELVICIALIMIGCVLFCAMPDEMGIWGWILFVAGTFLNVVGVFRLAAMVPEAKSDFGKKIVILISIASAAFIQFIGLLYLYKSGGTGKGAAIATLALCISLGLIIYAVDFENKKQQKRIKIVCVMITIILIAIAAFLIIRDDFSNASVFVGTILLIEALITGKIGFSAQK
ncbi:hypothetical protein [Butyrivibrio sp. JL13D10]|uniref:hypothetical protein n=1 Tax=Butyrivibrio sp. JL13D10 TaxID=3236815 RepID=UPI0038B5F966